MPHPYWETRNTRPQYRYHHLLSVRLKIPFIHLSFLLFLLFSISIRLFFHCDRNYFAILYSPVASVLGAFGVCLVPEPFCAGFSAMCPQAVF